MHSLFSIPSNALPLAVKPVAGVLTGSASVLPEAVYFATKLVVSVVAFVAVRRSNSPPDEESSVLEGFMCGEVESNRGIREDLRRPGREDTRQPAGLGCPRQDRQ